MMWLVATTDDFDAWYNDLDEAEKAEIIAKVELLKVLGPQLRRPHADTLKGSKHSNMRELRGKTACAVLRIAFAFNPNRRGILLMGGDKSGVAQEQFYKALIAKADKLYGEHLAPLKRKGKSNG